MIGRQRLSRQEEHSCLGSAQLSSAQALAGGQAAWIIIPVPSLNIYKWFPEPSRLQAHPLTLGPWLSAVPNM